MTDINGIQGISASKSVQPIDISATSSIQQIGLDSISDVVEISTASMLAAKVQDLPPVRTELIARIKSEIATGTYETEERLNIAVNRLMDELAT
ncbi:MAG: flagellar biosynthesis anti-sigma factor FlgM [Planctomycetes bacterium]|nr:flagellar biosynthesis anti-sigma factor FlgM [Planctomycetota bacterium]